MKKSKISSISFMQALGVVVYCALIAGFLMFMGNSNIEPAGYLGSVLILLLLVFSAATCGTIVFGYPVYLAINKKTREALQILVYTLLYCLGIIAVAILLLFIFV